jgi:hypothetical protein
MSRLHGAHGPTQCDLATEKARGRSLSSCSSLRRGAWPGSSSSAIKIESSARVCSPVGSVCAARSGDVGADGASSMEWLSSTSSNPMEDWLRKGDEREGDAWREECGVVAIFGDPEASRLCYLALHALQHRGQEGAGIVTANEHTLHAVTGNRSMSYNLATSVRFPFVAERRIGIQSFGGSVADVAVWVMGSRHGTCQRGLR